MGKIKLINGADNQGYYSRLFRKFIFLTLICSLVPLLIVGWLINVHYTGLAKSRMISQLRTQVEYHSKIIDLFLRERRSKLQLIAETNSVDDLSKMPRLFDMFQIMNQEYGSITDLGVIDDKGRHLAYIGPYNLMDKNYSQEPWFGQVMEQGVYISYMFTGFRKVPHFVIAVARQERRKNWILRATIDTEFFRSLVENVRIGETGEVFLLNEEGIFQTSPRFSGRIMEKSSLPLKNVQDNDISIDFIDPKRGDSGSGSHRQVVARTWLKELRWMLVVRQDYSEAFDEVNHANYATLIFLHLSALTILIVSVFITKYMIKVIRKRDQEADQLTKQLMQAGKMASIGELSAGVAHEINNPLAIVLTERQILLDAADQAAGLDEDFKSQLKSSLSQIDSQVHRCKRITQNLLRFSRRTRSMIETVDINSFLKEVAELMEREAKSSGIQIIVEPDENMPAVLSDPSQLQQVFLNLISNAIDAHDGRPYGTIRIRTRSDDQEEGFEVLFSDTGTGIAPENLGRIFDPFFTTKPVGKGSGLGLSICYSIIKNLGGEIEVKSELGKGAEFRIFLPYRPPPHVLEAAEEKEDLA